MHRFDEAACIVAAKNVTSIYDTARAFITLPKVD